MHSNSTIENSLLDQNLIKFLKEENGLNFEIREFLSKSRKIFENIKYLIINDSNYEHVFFYPLMLVQTSEEIAQKYSSISFCHSFHYDSKENKIKLFIDRDSCSNEQIRARNELQIKWLKDNLMLKLDNWCLKVKTNSYASCAKLNTLTLYDNMVEDYMKLYQSLKEIYWCRFVDSWFELTNTNPEKFIHEDVSIATYLILMWNHFKINVKCFVGRFVHLKSRFYY